MWWCIYILKERVSKSIRIIFHFSFQDGIGYVFLCCWKTPCPWMYVHIRLILYLLQTQMINKIILLIWHDKEINKKTLQVCPYYTRGKDNIPSHGNSFFIKTNIWTKVKILLDFTFNEKISYKSCWHLSLFSSPNGPASGWNSGWFFLKHAKVNFSLDQG